MTNEIRYDSKGNILLEGEGERKGGCIIIVIGMMEKEYISIQNH